MEFLNVLEMDIKINGIDCTELSPIGKKPEHAIVFYHGFTSSREKAMFRGKIFASLGYYVLMVEQMGHGTRSDEFKIGDFSIKPDGGLFEIVIKSISESPSIINYICEKKGFNANNLVIAGHSMGSMVAAGIFVKNPFGSLLCFNGALDYNGLINRLNRGRLKNDEAALELKNTLRYYNPAEFLSKLENRPICIIDGDKDPVIPTEINKEVIHVLKPFYNNKNLLEYNVITNASHKMTTESIAIAVNFLESEDVKNYGKQNK